MKKRILNRFMDAAMRSMFSIKARMQVQQKPCALALGPDDTCEFGPYGPDGERMCQHCGADDPKRAASNTGGKP